MYLYIYIYKQKSIQADNYCDLDDNLISFVVVVVFVTTTPQMLISLTHTVHKRANTKLTRDINNNNNNKI